MGAAAVALRVPLAGTLLRVLFAPCVLRPPSGACRPTRAVSARCFAPPPAPPALSLCDSPTAIAQNSIGTHARKPNAAAACVRSQESTWCSSPPLRAAVGGNRLDPQPRLALLDIQGNPVTSADGMMTIAAVGPASLVGETSARLVAGIAQFQGLRLDMAGTYTLRAAYPTQQDLAPIATASFDVVAGKPGQLKFSGVSQMLSVGEPVGGTVKVYDNGDNLAVDFDGVIKLAMAGGSVGALALQTGAVLPALAPLPAGQCQSSGGLATPYTSDGGDCDGWSGTTEAECRAACVANEQAANCPAQPCSYALFYAAIGQCHHFSYAPAPEYCDSVGSGQATLWQRQSDAVVAEKEGAYLRVVQGVATLEGLGLFFSTPGTVSVMASADTGGSACGFSTKSPSIFVTAGFPDAVQFREQPDGARGGSPFLMQPVLEVVDVAGNVAYFQGELQISVVAHSSGAVLEAPLCAQRAACISVSDGVVIVRAVDGVVDLQSTGLLLIAKRATALTLTASIVGVPEVAAAVSIEFAVESGPAVAVEFTTAPAGATGGDAFLTQPEARLLDAGGNPVDGEGSWGSITLTVLVGPLGYSALGPADAITAEVNAGVALWSGLKLNEAGSYTLNVEAVPATGASITTTVGPLAVDVGAAAGLIVVVEPGDATGGMPLQTQPRVRAVDAGGNHVTTYAGQVAVTLAPGGTAGAQLSDAAGNVPPAPITCIGGEVNFSAAALRIDLAGVYSLTLAPTDGASVDTASLTVSVGVPATVAFAVEPTAACAGAWGLCVRSASQPLLPSPASQPCPPALPPSPAPEPFLSPVPAPVVRRPSGPGGWPAPLAAALCHRVRRRRQRCGRLLWHGAAGGDRGAGPAAGCRRHGRGPAAHSREWRGRHEHGAARPTRAVQAEGHGDRHGGHRVAHLELRGRDRAAVAAALDETAFGGPCRRCLPSLPAAAACPELLRPAAACRRCLPPLPAVAACRRCLPRASAARRCLRQRSSFVRTPRPLPAPAPSHPHRHTRAHDRCQARADRSFETQPELQVVDRVGNEIAGDATCVPDGDMTGCHSVAISFVSDPSALVGTASVPLDATTKRALFTDLEITSIGAATLTATLVPAAAGEYFSPPAMSCRSAPGGVWWTLMFSGGQCDAGFYSEAPDVDGDFAGGTLDDCKAICAKEAQCEYFSFNPSATPGNECARYDSGAGDCTQTAADHETYKKEPNPWIAQANV